MTSTHVGTGYRDRGVGVRKRAVAGVGAVLLLAAMPSGASAAEPPDGGCPVVAAAQGVQVTVSASDNLLLAAPAGAGVPVAQACVDYGVRDSTAFASSPYPGESVIAAPGLISNQTGQEMPAYPAYAASRYPAKEHAEAEQPGYSLRADSSETSSAARARSALAPEDTDAGSTLATAQSVVDPATTAATSIAKSDIQPLTINDVLRLGRVHSVASAKVGSDGKVQRASDLRIGHTTVAGQEVVITPEGVHAAGQEVPVLQTPPADVLEQAGITVHYLSAERTRSGVLSAGLEITARQQDPESGAVTTVHYTLGRSFAAAVPAEGEPGAGPIDPEGGVSPPADGGSAGDGGVADAPVPESTPEQAEVPAGADGTPPPDVAGPDQLVANPVDVGVTGLYLVLMLGALVMFASGTLLRLLGVKTRWTS